MCFFHIQPQYERSSSEFNFWTILGWDKRKLGIVLVEISRIRSFDVSDENSKLWQLFMKWRTKLIHVTELLIDFPEHLLSFKNFSNFNIPLHKQKKIIIARMDKIEIIMIAS